MNSLGWVLVLFAHVGAMGDGNSNALTVAYFSTNETCEAAGKSVQKLTRGTVKKIEYTCNKQ